METRVQYGVTKSHTKDDEGKNQVLEEDLANKNGI